jgi:hypothetical protein
MVNPSRARMTVLAAWVADQHEKLRGSCLLAPDGDTTCPNPATHRIQFTTMPGHDEGPVTFACAHHVDHYRTHPAVTGIRKVNP